MAKLSLLVALTLLLSLPAAAEDTQFVSAKRSPLTRAREVPPNETRFSGQAQVTGTFVVLWEQGTEGYPGYFRVVIKPDAWSRAILPHDLERGPVRELWLRNTETAVREFIGPARAASLRKGRAQQATGTVTVVVGSYRTGVDCDQRGYDALLLKVVRAPAQVAVVSRKEQLDGC